MIMDIIKKLLPRSGVCEFSAVKPFLLPCRAAQRLPQDARSVIVSVFPYYLGAHAYKNLNVSKYAAVPDYHDVVLARLQRACEALTEQFAGEQFIPFVDNSPIPEVYAAYLAGLGVRGKNGLLITEEFGSYVFIGEIVTTLTLAPDVPVTGGCEACGKCTAECVGGALKGGFCREKCLSEITQKRGKLTCGQEELIARSGSAWGCDVCQDVCPMNVHAGISDVEEFLLGARAHVVSGEPVSGRAYAWRGRDIIERNLILSQGKE